MVAYSFKQRFVGPLLEGVKRQTIRADRKRHARVGETVQLYYGMRTRHCTLIGTAICESVHPITIEFTFDGKIITAGSTLTRREQTDRFAQLDGFPGWTEMKDFWTREHPDINPFSGVMIRWENFQRA